MSDLEESNNNIVKNIMSQASVVPGMTEKYRCLMVWDTSINMDVGWLMVRKQDVEDLSPEEIEVKMKRSQWRTWNLSASGDGNSNVSSSKDGVDSNSEGNLVKNSNEASTSTEDKTCTNRTETIQVNRSVQVGEDLILNLKYSGKTDVKKLCLGEMAEIDSSLLDKITVVQAQKTMENKTKETYSTMRKQTRNLEDTEKARKRSKLETDEYSEDSELKSCNVCSAKMLYTDLLIHRKQFHPERFKADLVFCSGCNVKVKAVEFSSHTCVVLSESDSDESVIFEDIDIPSNAELAGADKDHINENIETLNMEVVSADKGHENDNIDKLLHQEVVSADKGHENDYIDNLLHMEVVSADKGHEKSSSDVDFPSHDLLKCKDCLVVFSNEHIDYHECSSSRLRTFVMLSGSKIEETNVEGNTKQEEKDEIQMLDEQSICEDCGICFDSKELHNCEHGGEDVHLEKESTKKDDFISSARVIQQRPSVILRGRGEDIVMWSAKVIHQPPLVLLKGQAFYFSIQLLDNKDKVLNVKDVFMSPCSNYYGLQFMVQLLQSDGSISQQSLWVSVCSETAMRLEPNAEVQKCLLPQQFACRKMEGDLLQFCLSSEYYCSKGTRVKLMVSSQQKVLSFSNEMFINRENQLFGNRRITLKAVKADGEDV